MFGDFLDDLADLAGTAVGTVCGIAIAPIAILLGVTETAVRTAVRQGCRTVDEIKAFIDNEL